MDLGLPCIHCGLCLDSCPTYRVLGNEAESPRGRIYLMEALEQGTLAWDAQAKGHLDSCLGCLACESACPSGVSYGNRIERLRPQLRPAGLGGLRRAYLAKAARSRGLLRSGMAAVALLDRFGLARLRRRAPSVGLLPARGSGWWIGRRSPLARSRVPLPPQPRICVALLTGCAGDVLRPQINRAAVEVLHRNGIAVIEAVGETCCGALALHGGRHEEALELARRNTRAFLEANVDYVVTTAAGCGAMLKDYGRLLAADRQLAELASKLARKSRDIAELLVEQGFRRPLATAAVQGPVLYHDACHLLHACSIRQPPRALLEAALGKPAADLGENDICCGSAGSYNLDHTAIAEALGQRKAELACRAQAGTIAVGNSGCALQIERALTRLRAHVPVVHPVELLADAYRNEDR